MADRLAEQQTAPLQRHLPARPMKTRAGIEEVFEAESESNRQPHKAPEIETTFLMFSYNVLLRTESGLTIGKP